MKLNNDIWALIPARSGSKGVKDKNIKSLCGYPLIAWTISACIKSNCFSRVIVSTDSEKYAKIARKYGAEVPYLRSKSISGDKASDYEWVKELIDNEISHCNIPSFFAHMRATTPLRDPKVIKKAINFLYKHSKATSLRSVHEMSETAYKCYEINHRKLLMPLKGLKVDLDDTNKGRQQFPKTFVANGYIDILKYKTIKEKMSIHGDKIVPIITESTLEIDTNEDFNHIKYKLFESKNIKNKIFGK